MNSGSVRVLTSQPIPEISLSFSCSLITSSFEEILRIGTLDYLRTDNDILRAPQDMSGVIETPLAFGVLQYVFRLHLLNPFLT